MSLSLAVNLSLVGVGAAGTAGTSGPALRAPSYSVAIDQPSIISGTLIANLSATVTMIDPGDPPVAANAVSLAWRVGGDSVSGGYTVAAGDVVTAVGLLSHITGDQSVASGAVTVVEGGIPAVSLAQDGAGPVIVSWSSEPVASSYDLRWRRQADATWVTIVGAVSPTLIANPDPSTTYLVEVRSIFGATVGSWSETAVVFTDAVQALWTPADLMGFLADYDATDAATITTDAGGVTAVAPKRGGLTLTTGGPQRVGQAVYDPVDKVLNGNGSTNSLYAAAGALPTDAPNGITTTNLNPDDGLGYFFVLRSSGVPTATTNPLTTEFAPQSVFGSNYTSLQNAIFDGASHIAAFTRKRDWASGQATNALYIDGVLTNTNTSAAVAKTYVELWLLASKSGYMPPASSSLIDVQYFGVMRGVLSEADRQKYEGWMRANMPLVTGVVLRGADGVSPHPYVANAPTTGAGAPAQTLTNEPTLWGENTTMALIPNGYRATATAAPTQLYGSEAVDVTPGAALRFTGKIKAPAGTYPLVRVSRNATMTPTGRGRQEEYLIDFITERVMVADGTAQTFMLDFLAPNDIVHLGFRLPNAPLGTEIEVTELALTAQPETVAQGSTALANTIEHDGVVFDIQKADGSPVKIGRYFSDGSYWALNDEPLTNPVRLTKARIAGRPDALSVMPYAGYSHYGSVLGELPQQFNNTGQPFNGAGLDTIYERASTDKIVAEGRLDVAYSAFDTDLNVSPYKTGLPVVFDKTVGIDHTIEADRVSAPTEAIFVQEVGNDNITGYRPQHGTNYWVTLAVVGTEPAADAFRPPLTQRGARNVPLHWSDIAANVAALPNDPTPAEAIPSLVAAEDAVIRLIGPPVADATSLGQSGRGRGRRFGGQYARETLLSMNNIAAGLILDFWTAEEKARIAALIVQHGLDYAGRSVDRPTLRQHAAGSNTGVMLHSIRFALKMAEGSLAPGETLLSDAAGLFDYWSDTTQRQRVTQHVIDTKTASHLGHNGPHKSPAQRRPPAALGEMIWLQADLAPSENRDLYSGRTPSNASGNFAAPYWGQDIATSFIYDIVLQRIGAPSVPEYTEAVDKEYYRKLKSDAFGVQSDSTAPLATLLYENNRSTGQPISASQWGLEPVPAVTQGKADGLTMLRPLYPGVANASWMNLRDDEFMGTVFSYADPLQYEVLTTSSTYGVLNDMTTTPGVNATTLIPGLTLNPTTGVIAADGTQVATPLQWFKVRAWNGAGEAFAVIAVEVADNHLRSVYTSYSFTSVWAPLKNGVYDTRPDENNVQVPVPDYPTVVKLKFQANLRGASAVGGTLYWVMTEDPAYRHIVSTNPNPRPQDAPSAAQVKLGQRADGTPATFSGSIPATADVNGWTAEFGMDNGLDYGTIYDLSVYWEPAAGIPPPVVLQSVGSQHSGASVADGFVWP